jgi:hypothetical protein
MRVHGQVYILRECHAQYWAVLERPRVSVTWLRRSHFASRTFCNHPRSSWVDTPRRSPVCRLLPESVLDHKSYHWRRIYVSASNALVEKRWRALTSLVKHILGVDRSKALVEFLRHVRNNSDIWGKFNSRGKSIGSYKWVISCLCCTFLPKS